MRVAWMCALVGLALAVPAGAEGCVPTTSEPEVDTRVEPRFYFDNDSCQQCMWTFWVYQESNGIDGLQRRDEVKDDTCDGQIPSDTIIF